MNWFTSLLNKVGGKSSSYILLVFGVMLAIIAFAQFPIDDADPLTSETIWESAVLGGFSLILLVSGLVFAFRDDNFNKRQEIKKQEVDNLNEEIRIRDEQIFKLDETIKRAKNFILDNKDSNSRFIPENVLKILDGVSQDFSDFSAEDQLRRSASAWLRQRISKYALIASEDKYADYGIDRENLDEFRKEIEMHLTLLCENIESGKNSAPRLARPPVPQTFGSYDLYKKVINEIEKEVYEDFAEDDSLSHSSIEKIKSCLSTFIEFIGYE